MTALSAASPTAARQDVGTQRAPHDTVLVTLTTLWLIGVPLMSGHGERLAASLPSVTFARAGLLVVAASLALRWIWTPRAAPMHDHIGWAWTAYLAVIIFSWLGTVHGKPPVALKQDADFLLTSFVMPLAAFAVARTVVWSDRRVRWCIAGIVCVVGIYLVVVGTVQYLLDPDFLADAAAQQVHRDRAKGPFGNALPYGMTLLILLPFALVLWRQARHPAARIGLAGLVAALTQGLVLSKGRAVWLAVAVSLAWTAARRPAWRVQAGLVTLLLVAQVVALPLLHRVTPAVQRLFGNAYAADLDERLEETNSLRNRVAVYVTDLHMIRARPLAGFGFGLLTFHDHKANYYASCCGVPVKWVNDCNVPHNEFLNVLVLTGMIGLAAFLALLASAWRGVAQALRAVPAGGLWSDIVLATQAMLVGLLVVGLFHDLMYVGYVQLLGWFFVGLATTAHRVSAA